MHKRLLLLLLIPLLFGPLAVRAETDQASAEMIALEIRNLSTSVDRLTRLLYDQGLQKEQDDILRKLDIAVAYLNFRSRRIEVLERDLQGSRSTRSRLEDVIRQWEQRLERIEQAADSSTPPEQVDLNRDEAAQQLKMLRQRLSRLDGEIVGYENRVIELQNDLDSVESFVERNLKL